MNVMRGQKLRSFKAEFRNKRVRVKRRENVQCVLPGPPVIVCSIQNIVLTVFVITRLHCSTLHTA